MRILMITATYPPSVNGVAITVENLKNSLKDLGHEVKVLAPENNSSTEDLDVIRYPSISNPVIKDYPIPLFPGIKSIYNLITSFKPDIVHVHHPLHVGFFAKIIADQYRIPLIFTFHTRYDLYAEKYVTFLPKKLKSDLVENSIIKFCEKADCVIAPSNFVKETLNTKYPYLNIETIPAPVAGMISTKLTKNEIRKKLKLPLNKKILLTVARLGKEKNLEILIESISNLSSEHVLVIAGDGPDADQLKKLSITLNLTKRVTFLGNIPHSELGYYYKASDYFYYSSKTETQGLVFLEALMFGLPIVAVDSPASKEWVNDNFGILASDNHKALSGAVNVIEKRNYKNLSKEAIKYSNQFSPNTLSKKLLDVYSKIIERKRMAIRLLSTGWQSWSPLLENFSFYPLWNYKPNKDCYLPDNFQNIKLKKPITGWCSWYSFGLDISERKIIDQANFIKNNFKDRVEFILADDGWTKRGDWNIYDSDKFPSGMLNFRKRINKLGFKSGIWMAPFQVDYKSEFFKEYRRYLVRNNGVLVNGLRSFPLYDFINPFYILDVRKKNIRGLIKKNIDLLLGVYGFELIKLDFLYSIFFIPGISEKEAGYYLRELFTYIQKRYPNVYTIACGTPLAPIIGVADSVRIGPDIISPYFSDKPFINKFINGSRLNLVEDSLENRKWTDKYWNVDPDVFVCRKSLGYTSNQITRLQNIIREAKGNIFLGDDLTKLSKKYINQYIDPILK